MHLPHLTVPLLSITAALALGGLVPGALVTAGAAPAATVPSAAVPLVADPDLPDPSQLPDPEPDDVLDVDRGGVTTPGAQTTTWSLVPADEDGPDDRTSLRHELDPGQEVTDHVALTNYTDQAVTFALAAGDGLITDTGDFDLPPTATAPTAAGAWVEVTDAVEVPALETVVVPVTVTVPQDARPGDHPAGVVASVTTTTEGEDGGQVALDSRVGVRLHLRVTGDLTAALTVQDATARYAPSWNPFAPGQVEITYVLANTGDVRLGATPALTVDPWLGAPAVVDGVPVREVLPGGQVATSVVVDGVWPVGFADVHLTAVPAVVGADEVPGALTEAAASLTVRALPVPHLLLLATLVAAVVVVRVLRRRSAARLVAATEHGRLKALAAT
ncbi:hypothetical protein [Cellulomonas bogoriensis]|uniref:DUF916 domain-containing protein n=1 Tax=Cellulomonas bogoriensis 69B4 = DSM 16987 TaxID=1386082 RepID=A0A0A0C2L0_9CELL|nr:hypothetical protein [Cellulomonas bogoriensis]KGM13604.1 hypothetical protein N869_10010 [Cellulomonas bogoriensis 69B4 = DSM 16987]